MKKLLFIVLLVCIKQVNAQSDVKKATNTKYLKGTAINRKKVIKEDGTLTKANGYRTVQPKTTSSSCPASIYLSGSWNPNGVGASADCIQQNCLAYNQNLNALVWTQRGSQNWSLFPTSGGYQATIISNAVPSPTATFVTNVLDSVVLYRDSLNIVGGRFPGGSWLNPAGNTNWHNAYSCVIGPYNAAATGDWLGSIYVAKPLWSTSAVTHTTPTLDSLHCVSGSAGGPFGPTPIGGSANWFGAPNCDGQQVGNTMFSTGNLLDLSVTVTNGNLLKGGFLSKATMASPGVVNWSVDSTSLRPNFAQSNLGYLNATTPRLAFAPDGLHGYAVYIGKLANTFGNSADSAMTPIVFQTTDGGNTWNQVLQGYDWATMHPEVMKNVGCGSLSSQRKTYYSFSTGYYGVDVTVDANNVLHYVSVVNEPYHGANFTSPATDSMGVFTYSYDYDYINYHPIVWDFTTDGTTWNTMMVDSLQSSQCNGISTDTTSPYSPWPSTAPDFLTIGAHLTVSRTPDGTKIFYGWADTPIGTTTLTGNPNIYPDIFVVGYDVTDTMLTAATNITNLGYCFFPYIADMSYYDSTQSAWVVPAVYTVSRYHVANPTLPIDSTTDYYYTNCGALTASDFRLPAKINLAAHHAASGINQLASNINLINIYPNPTNGSFVIDPNNNTKQTITLYDVSGKMVLSQTIAGKTNIDASSLNEGVYNISITSSDGVVNKRLVIVR